ncbi:hypothetical protein RhiJN_26492 [Ceratobasidium sp. AG-Ba]|nr:hypothetical protein RhiJN_26492 [Ceratobasidium sp. AG-Ba]
MLKHDCASPTKAPLEMGVTLGQVRIDLKVDYIPWAYACKIGAKQVQLLHPDLVAAVLIHFCTQSLPPPVGVVAEVVTVSEVSVGIEETGEVTELVIVDSDEERDSDVELDLDMELDSDVELDVGTDSEVELDLDVEIDSDVELDSDVDLDLDVELDSEVELGSDVELDLDVGLGSGSDQDFDVEVGSDSEVGLGVDLEVGSGSGDEVGLGLEVGLELDEGLGVGVGVGSGGGVSRGVDVVLGLVVVGFGGSLGSGGASDDMGPPSEVGAVATRCKAESRKNSSKMGKRISSRQGC